MGFGGPAELTRDVGSCGGFLVSGQGLADGADACGEGGWPSGFSDLSCGDDSALPAPLSSAHGILDRA